MLDFIEIKATEETKFTIVWLHGLGSHGKDLVPIVRMLNPELGNKANNIRHIFPISPMQRVTVNNNMRMRAWYDIVDFGFSAREDFAGISESHKLLLELLNQQIQSTENVIIAGFSQGGAVSLFTALQHPTPFAAVIALSTYLPVEAQLTPLIKQTNLSIFMAHGTLDPIVPIEMGKRSCDKLIQLGCQVQWRTYLMQHTVMPEEIVDIATFISKIF